ncbi:MAG: hypothetical protein WCS65_14400 [Verrucomicrobiae bacterium]
MAEQQFADEIVRRLAASFRVVTLGGVAVITHGLSRNTHDLDVWLDPMESSNLWCSAVLSALVESPGLDVIDIRSFLPVEKAEFPEVIEHYQTRQTRSG